MPATATRPAPSEHLPYYSRYIELVHGDDVRAALKSQLRETLAMLACVSNEESASRYEPGKWTVREVLGHMIDTERIMAYRALRIGRGDKTPIEGFEQDDYVKGGNFNHVRWSALCEEFDLVRRSTVSLFSGFSEEAWSRSGTANNAAVTTRALAWIIAGHELHHRTIIEQRYLKHTSPRVIWRSVEPTVERLRARPTRNAAAANSNDAIVM